MGKYKKFRHSTGPHRHLIQRIDLRDAVPPYQEQSTDQEEEEEVSRRTSSTSTTENPASDSPDLPVAGVHFPFELSSRLESLQKRILASRKALDRGQLLQAWIAVPSLLRAAQVHGCQPKDRSKSSQETTLKTREQQQQRWIWTELVELDASLSFCLGQPFCVTSSQIIKKPYVVPIEDNFKALQACRQKFVTFMLETMRSIIPTKPDEGEAGSMSDRLRQVPLQQLNAIRDSLPSLTHPEGRSSKLLIATAEYHLEVHLFTLVLLCHLLALESQSTQGEQASFAEDQFKEEIHEGRRRSARLHPTPPKEAGFSHGEIQGKILPCARETLHVFGFLKQHVHTRKGPGWKHCFGALAAATIIWMAALTSDDDVDTDCNLIQEFFTILQNLDSTSTGHLMHEVASVWMEKDVLKSVKGRQTRQQVPGEVTGVDAPSTTSANLLSKTPSQQGHVATEYKNTSTSIKRQNIDDTQFEPSRDKRRRVESDVPSFQAQSTTENAHWTTTENTSFDNNSAVPYDDLMLDDVQNATSAFTYREPYMVSQSTSANTSFTHPEPLSFGPMVDESGLGGFNGQISAYYLQMWGLHPPMILHPPMTIPNPAWYNIQADDNDLEMHMAAGPVMPLVSPPETYHVDIDSQHILSGRTLTSPVSESNGNEAVTPSAAATNVRHALSSPSLSGQPVFGTIGSESLRGSEGHRHSRKDSGQEPHSTRMASSARPDTVENASQRPREWQHDTSHAYGDRRPLGREERQMDGHVPVQSNAKLHENPRQTYPEPGTNPPTRRNSWEKDSDRRMSIPATVADQGAQFVNEDQHPSISHSFTGGQGFPNGVSEPGMVGVNHHVTPVGYAEPNHAPYSSTANVYQPYLRQINTHQPMVTTGPYSAGHQHQSFWHV